jgi:5-methylcytosine-specific restriction endonuclease McrA
VKRSPIQRRTPLQRLTSIRPKSPKRVRQDRTRAFLRRQFLIAYPECERCGNAATDVHEVIRRSQAPGAQLRPELFVGLCRPCHEWATVNPAEAHAEGFVLWSWEDHDTARMEAAEKRRLRRAGW